MNAMHTRPLLRLAHTQRGFTLVELMVTVGIALFLLWGLTTVMQNVRQANLNQSGLANLQDQERFALTVLTDVVQSGGYVPADDATALTVATALLADPPFGSGQAFFGSHPAGLPDTLSVRYYTDNNDGVILCDGSTNQGAANYFTNTFSVQQAAPGVVGGLYCQLQVGNAAPAAAVLLVPGVQSMTVYYGVKRDVTYNDYNVDTYLTADQMLAADWSNVSAVRVILTFTNPLINQPGQQPTITFERVIQVMARGGVHT
jgi:type IV pilus assembly protein PilW